MKTKLFNILIINLLIFFLWGCFSTPKERRDIKSITLKKVVKTSTDEGAFYIIDGIREYQNSLNSIKNLISQGFKIFLDTKRLYTIEIVAVGDIIPHGIVKNSGKKSDGSIDFSPLFKEIVDDIKGADISFGNLETPYHPEKELWRSIPFSFNIPLEMLEEIQKTGFNILTLANNHMFDQGVDGVKHTINTLNKLKIQHIGAGVTHSDAKKEVIIEKKGVKIGFIGYTTIINNDQNNYSNTKTPYINRYDSESAKKEVLSLRKNSDIVIISMHWGDEYHNFPSQAQKNIAKELFSWGVDIIIGHHPHVLQPIVPKYRENTLSDSKNISNKPIIEPQIVVYSLGNFISNQFFDVNSKHSRHKQSNREGAILKITLIKKNDVIKLDSYGYIATLGCKSDEKNYKIHICRDDKSTKQSEFKKLREFLGPENVYPEAVKEYIKPFVEIFNKKKRKKLK